MSTARDAYARARLLHLRPALKALGFRVKSPTTWLRGSAEDGWIIVDIGGNRHNTRDEGEWGVGVHAWPPGTWEWERTRSGRTAVEPENDLPPLYAGLERVGDGSRAEQRDVARFVGEMSDEAVEAAAQRLLAHATKAIGWLEGVLAAGTADEFTRPEHVLGAAEVTGAWTPSRVELLDALTVAAQRGVWKPSWQQLAHWRAVAGLPEVPFPGWYHRLMRKEPPQDRFRSPRAAFESGHARSCEVLLPDGRSCQVEPHVLPDARQLRAWRRVARRLPDHPLVSPPDWLPWHEWVLR